MAYFEGIEMTGGYGNGPDIISSCSVNVNKGEIVSILGPNGAGKSTAMKAMLGLLNLKSGSVKIDDNISSFGAYGNPYQDGLIAGDLLLVIGKIMIFLAIGFVGFGNRSLNLR